ncbi:MAG: 3'-5' exonuclease [Candidatus Aenigmarchaeota archaeon]|nr:3'-5' exonuclease [Candidatus Aenigmarchaeota archaeon]
MIVVDIETTGMEPEKNSLLSIGALDFSNPKNTFYGECRADEGASVSNIALKINGFSREQIHDPEKPTSKELLQNFLKWMKPIKDKTIAGDNIWFDTGFLQENFRRIGVKYPFKGESIELHEISPLLAGLPWSLDAALYMSGIPPRTNAHNALDDAELTAEVISRLMNGKNLLKRFRKYPVPDIFIEYVNIRNRKK